ncbi:MAG TPA: Dyp-type peroxidase [Candidatus Dormibacteraeota bacterium]|nr:Dyp-type peroxidase [Candidatus Dormibacteraeota bacterium]
MTDLDLGRIQGFVVRGYRLPLAEYIFLRIDDPVPAAAWIAEITNDVLTAAPWSAKPDSGVNIAFSYAGLSALQLPSATLASFPQDFREGMAARAAVLGDEGDNAPANWEGPLGREDVHILVVISAAHQQALNAHDLRIRTSIEQAGGLTTIYDDIGSALAGNREHFGYADGFAQPDIEGVAPSQPGGGAPLRDSKWRPIRAGEFIFGYPDEENVLPQGPTPDELGTNASFLVYRKLHQDVARFRAQLARSARLCPGGEDLLAAKIVGRWRDGTPIDLSPNHPDPAIVSDGRRNNAFSYSTDPDGLRCPIGAHVRRANPRDSLPFEGKLVNRHRLIRRGIPYGEPLPDGADDDGTDRGVIFMCLQASIARQFEFIQSQWLNRGNAFVLGEDQDVLLGPQDGPGPHKMTVPGNPPLFIGPLQRVVTVKGGEYFFVPGINGLEFIASAATSGAA